MCVCVCVCVEKDRWREITALLHLCYTLHYTFVSYSIAFCPVFHFLAFCPDTGFHSRIFAANSFNMNDISEYLDSCHVDLRHISDYCYPVLNLQRCTKYDFQKTAPEIEYCFLS